MKFLIGYATGTIALAMVILAIEAHLLFAVVPGTIVISVIGNIIASKLGEE